MAKIEKTIFYSNLYSDERFAKTKEILIEEGYTDVTDTDVWNRIDTENYFNWINFEKLGREKMEGKTYVLTGIKTVDGIDNFGGFLVEKFEDLYRATSICNSYEIVDQKGRLYINGEHNKGTFSCEIRELNKRGLDYYAKYVEKFEEKELLKKLTDKNYSKFAKLLKD